MEGRGEERLRDDRLTLAERARVCERSDRVLTIVIIAVIGSFIGTAIALSRKRRGVDVTRAAIAQVAHARGWRLTGEHGDIAAEHPSGEVLLLPSYGEGNPDGVMLVLVGRRSEIALSVWPRNPDASIAEQWGPEVETGDPIFDTRFVVHSRAPRSLVLAFLVPSVRTALLDLEEPALLATPERVAVLFSDLPDAPLLDRAIEVTQTIAAGCARHPSAPIAPPR